MKMEVEKIEWTEFFAFFIILFILSLVSIGALSMSERIVRVVVYSSLTALFGTRVLRERRRLKNKSD